ncbi:Fe2+-enterobactin ABC transporter substrate-binding protein [Leucobacter komagatae]|uniref:ABC transporter substrate-binding protein n=1 Tax=Leucobacter komagatae TaxID=55969 RepID=A0A0D0ILU3_9MICO|nr:Fe2+-enterobactin ABC transporter substrate-binding protein [Leucobacter komagatae]KIP52539.1 ABC transporter substrate-binding protein [Leucobacter komagatae]
MARRLPTLVAAAAAAALLLAGCSSTAPEQAAADTASESGGDWPRTIEHAAGSTTIDEQPLRIVSVAPSVTGGLLSIEAPLVATGAAPVTPLSDENGFFTQWADVAVERGVEVAYKDLELDIDAVDQFEPDLIIGSANGGDNALDAYEQLSEIAPTVLLDYGDATWQELTTQLAEITGLEDTATEVLADYDAWVAGEAKKLTLPPQPTTALIYMGAEGSWPFAPDSPQAMLLSSLGFDYQPPKDEFLTEGQGGRVGILTSENAPDGLADAETIMIVAMLGGDPVAEFSKDPLLANLPAITSDRVFTMGPQSFRLDYYSAKLTVELLVDTFSG